MINKILWHLSAGIIIIESEDTNQKSKLKIVFQNAIQIPQGPMN